MSAIGWRRASLWLSVVSAAALTAAGCASSSGASTSADRAAIRSGVGVVAEGCGLTASVGSGVVLESGDGDAAGEAVVVTVAHTIKGATTLTVVDADGEEHAARVVAFDKDSDLAVLAVAELSAPSIGITDDPATAVDGVDGSILTWGRDDGVEQVPVVIVKRLRVTIEDIYVDEVVARSALEIAGSVTGGDSGGPVLDAHGDVIGIVYANSRGRESVGFATDHTELAEVLESVTGDTVENGTCS